MVHTGFLLEKRPLRTTRVFLFGTDSESDALMVFGIGTDIFKKSRLIKFDGANPDPFYLKVFTCEELSQARLRSDSDNYLASRFAGKEAVFKCFGIDGNRVRLNEIEILTSDFGIPVVSLSGSLKMIASQIGIERIHISLSYDEDSFVAVAVAEG